MPATCQRWLRIEIQLYLAKSTIIYKGSDPAGEPLAGLRKGLEGEGMGLGKSWEGEKRMIWKGKVGLGADGEGLKLEQILKCRWKTESLKTVPSICFMVMFLFPSVTYF